MNLGDIISTFSVCILSVLDAIGLDLLKSLSIAVLTFWDALICKLNKINVPFQMSSTPKLRNLISPDSNIDQDTLLTRLKEYIRTSDPETVKDELEQILADQMFYLPGDINIYLNGCLDGIHRHQDTTTTRTKEETTSATRCNSDCNDYVIWATVTNDIITEMIVMSSPILSTPNPNSVVKEGDVPVSPTIFKACIYTTCGSLPPLSQHNRQFLDKLGIKHMRIYVHDPESGYYPATKEYVSIHTESRVEPQHNSSSKGTWIVVAVLIIAAALVYVVISKKRQGIKQ
jgi:hypothetical protein